jgi:hypothetical protein
VQDALSHSIFLLAHDNRNRPGRDVNDTFLLNELIVHFGILELHFKWSNMQDKQFVGT